MDFSAIHKFDFAGDKLLLDVNSGSVHLLGPLTDGLLREGERLGSLTAAAGLLAAEFGPEETGEALSQLERLIGEGLLFSAQPPEPEALPPTWLKSLCLNISHDCDLRCRYCFASGGDFGGGRRNMSFETARKALDMLLRESGPRPFCEVDFFGGEPLLNLETVKKTVAYGKEAAAAAGKKIKITFTTNALALSGETVDWLNGEGLSVVLSHDGRPETHDAMRRLPGGGKSYETINRHIKSFVASRPQGNYYIRGTYTNKNLDFCRDVEHWLEQGFREVSLEPVVAEPLFAGASWALTEEHLPRIREEYRRLAALCRERRLEGRPFNFFHFNIDLQRGPCLPKRLWGCGAGYEYLAVDPAGLLYPCHQFVGREGFCLGNVDEGVTNAELPRRFRAAHIYNKPACRACWARYFCSGGCHANAHAVSGDFLQPHPLGCLLQKERLECAIWLAVREVLDEPPVR